MSFKSHVLTPKTSKTGVALALVAALALAGCGSSVKLDETPVSDRTAVPVNPADAAGANAGGVGSRGVNGTEVGAAGLAGQAPQGLTRIVYFDFDDFTVRSEFTPVLEGHAKFLKADAKRKVVLEGHADERGGREYNLALGQKRSESVRRVLSLMGVNEAQMEPVSFGEEKPANPGTDEEAYRQNRRVELSYR